MEGYIANQDLTGVKFGKAPKVVLYHCTNIHLADFTEVEEWREVDVIGGARNIVTPAVTNALKSRAIAGEEKIPGFFNLQARTMFVRLYHDFIPTLPDGAVKTALTKIVALNEQRSELCWEDLVPYIVNDVRPTKDDIMAVIDCFGNQIIGLAALKKFCGPFYPTIRARDWKV